jgi:hypothetical protein
MANPETAEPNRLHPFHPIKFYWLDYSDELS